MEVQREQFPQVLGFLQGDILATQSLSDKKNVHFCYLKINRFHAEAVFLPSFSIRHINASIISCLFYHLN